MGLLQSGARQRKVIIVEGPSDKRRLEQVLDEPVRIICTHGTLGYEKMESLLKSVRDDEVYVLVDADESGNRLRNQLRREFPGARHLYTRKVYREVATTPLEHLADILARAHFEVNERWLSPDV
ncbi:toprim domain-containing protein [Alicyclobacillus kakegawensis]|uniref:toprim domain-containing protein n=1 Tax=Alicyclobacillus kakegawensis TaxID=392012 RepID=UPI0008354AF8|nr:toprim domain-containing protein [Alicyclobacillus kakegawensis]